MPDVHWIIEKYKKMGIQLTDENAQEIERLDTSFQALHLPNFAISLADFLACQSISLDGGEFMSAQLMKKINEEITHA